MSRLTDKLEAGGKILWLDFTDYAAQLLAGGSPPWNDVAATLAWLRKAQGLLRSDVIALPLAAVTDAWLNQHADLRTAIAAKQRLLVPLKTLLAAEDLRAHLVELVRGMRAGCGDAPLVLQLPSPRLWPALAHRQAFGNGGDPIEVSDDDADSAAVYIADFLRSFGEAGVDALLLVESDATVPASAESLELYQPVINIAQHYRWSIGLLSPRARGFDAGTLDYAIAPDGDKGLLLGEEFWQGSGKAAVAGLRYAIVPVNMKPESVLAVLASDRAALVDD